MLRKLRHEKFMRGVMIATLFIVVPSFVVFYGWQQSKGSNGAATGAAAKVKFGTFGASQEVTRNDMARAREMLIARAQNYGRLTGERIDRKVLEQVSTQADVAHEAVNLKLLERFAEEHGIVVNHNEVVEQLKRQIPPQQRAEVIQMIESQHGMSFDQFVDRQLYALLIGRIREALATQTRVSLHEAWLAFQAKQEKLVLDYVKFVVPDYLPKVKSDEKDLEQYFEQHREEFRIPDQVSYAFILVKKGDLRTSVTVSEDDITSHYAGNKEDYRLPAQAKVRQIMLERPRPEPGKPVSPEEMTSRTLEVREKANQVYQRAVKGEDFATLANLYSEEKAFPPREEDLTTTGADATTTAGGYLGYVSRTTAETYYGDEWTSTVFNLATGALHPPIETPRGFFILKAEDRKEGVLQPLDKVRDMIREQIIDEKVQPLFEAAGEELRENSRKFTSIEKLAEVTSQTVATTSKVDKGVKFIPGVMFLGEFEEPIADLEKGGRTDVLSDANRHLVIEAREEFPAHEPALNEVREKAEQKFREHKARELAHYDAENLKSKSVDIDAMRLAAVDMGLTVTRSSPFSRDEVQTVVGDIANFDVASREAKTGTTELSTLGSEKQIIGYAVWHVTEKTSPEQGDFAKELPRLMNELADRKVETLINEYLRDQWNSLGKAIEINPAFQR
jgi:peptidyl-prolyl cis-trans isomerase D